MNPSDAEAPRPAASAASARFRVGDFRLDVTANELTGTDGRVQRIEPRLMALLVRLARTPGAVVSRDTLIDEVWARRMVNDEVLSRAIADLRQALGDDSRTPRYIETIPKSGYRLIANVAAEPDAADATDAAAGLTRPATPATRRTSFWPLWLVAGLALLMVGTAVLIVNLKQPTAKRDGQALRLAVETALREAKPLTASLGLEIGPRLSPDGKRVLYTLVENDQATLMLHDPALPSAQAVSEAGEYVTSAVFMPDGMGIVYRALTQDACRLRLKTAQGLRDIAPCARDEPARIDLSPDGKWLVRSKTHRDSLPAGLALQALDTGELRQLTTPDTADGEDSLPRFSPDGAQIAFVRGNSSTRTVWIIPTVGGAARKVSTLSGLTYGLAWLPEGHALLVAADWFGFRALNWLNLQDGSGQLIGARGARAPDFAAGRIVYENAVFQANLVRVPLAPGHSDRGSVNDAAQSAPVHPSTRYTSQPAYSPDGRSLAFISNREGVEAIYVATGAALRKLPLPDSHRYMRPQWSADGKAIYAVRMPVNADKSAPQQAVRIALADGAASVLALGDRVSQVSESRDGRWLYVGEREERLMRLWRAPLDASSKPGKLERLPTPLVGEVQVGRDRIAFTQTGLQGITVCSLDGQTCELKRLPTGVRHDDHWALTDRGLYFEEGAGAARRLKRHDLQSAAVTIVSALVPTTLGGGLAVHPNESELIVAREQPPSIDLMSGSVMLQK